MNRAPRRWKRSAPASEPVETTADKYRRMLGIGDKKPTAFFSTDANVECSGCGLIKPGFEFEQPIAVPAWCRDCTRTTR